jgi:hypothetical protein
MSISSSFCQRHGSKDMASLTASARSAASRPSSTSGWSVATPKNTTSSWTSMTLLALDTCRRHSCLAVVASQLPILSGYWMRSMCSSNRNHVAWATSAASLSASLNSRVMAQISRSNCSTSRSQAQRSPAAAPSTSWAMSGAEALFLGRSATALPAGANSRSRPCSRRSAVGTCTVTPPPQGLWFAGRSIRTVCVRHC